MKKNLVMNATTARKNFFQLLRDVGQHGYSATIVQTDTGSRFELKLLEEKSPSVNKVLIKKWDDIHMDTMDLKTIKKIILESKGRDIDI
jgi:hypothetical protein